MLSSMDMHHHFFYEKLTKLRKDFRIPVSKKVENNKKNGWKTLNCNSQKW